MHIEELKSMNKGLKSKNLCMRLSVYFILYVPLLVATITILYADGLFEFSTIDFSGISKIKITTLSVLLTIPFLLVDLLIRDWRRKHDFVVWCSIEKEIERRIENITTNKSKHE